ncbi:MAG: glycosyltransferase family 39 protein, partial [Acidobacteria bacterium]|nr:glycosyltransferase family 39 protein [Acidobacteriota bacterium]
MGRAAALPPALLLAGASAVFAALSLWSMSGDTSTYDEGVHLAAAYSYVQTGDYRLNPEHPPLAKLLAALPLLLMDLHWPEEPEAWRNSWEWDFGYRFLYLSGNDPDRLLFWGRAPTLLWGLLLIGSVYALTRELYGPPGALVALVLVSFSPTVLAHSHLITTDVIVAVLFFLSVTAFWKLFQEGSYRWCVYTGFLLGGALAAKFSAILLIPLGLWMGVVAALRRRDRPPASWVGTALQWAINLAIVAALAGLTLWGTYGFRQGVSPERSYELDWKAMESVAGGFGGQAVLWAADQGFLPDAYAYGYFYVQKHAAGGHPSFALGRYSQT